MCSAVERGHRPPCQGIDLGAPSQQPVHDSGRLAGARRHMQGHIPVQIRNPQGRARGLGVHFAKLMQQQVDRTGISTVSCRQMQGGISLPVGRGRSVTLCETGCNVIHVGGSLKNPADRKLPQAALNSRGFRAAFRLVAPIPLREQSEHILRRLCRKSVDRCGAAPFGIQRTSIRAQCQKRRRNGKTIRACGSQMQRFGTQRKIAVLPCRPHRHRPHVGSGSHQSRDVNGSEACPAARCSGVKPASLQAAIADLPTGTRLSPRNRRLP